MDGNRYHVLAARNRQEIVVRMLLEKGADLDPKDADYGLYIV